MADLFERLIQARDSFVRGSSVTEQRKEVEGLIVSFLKNEYDRYLTYSAKADLEDTYAEDAVEQALDAGLISKQTASELAADAGVADEDGVTTDAPIEGDEA